MTLKDAAILFNMGKDQQQAEEICGKLDDLAILTRSILQPSNDLAGQPNNHNK
jgi:hypothetical protein